MRQETDLINTWGELISHHHLRRIPLLALQLLMFDNPVVLVENYVFQTRKHTFSWFFYGFFGFGNGWFFYDRRLSGQTTGHDSCAKRDYVGLQLKIKTDGNCSFVNHF